MSRPLNLTKLKSEVLYVLRKVGRTDFHKLFKILYFADIQHLKERGRPIVNNDFVAMKNGPVPSTLYDIIKDVKYDTYTPSLPNWRGSIFIENYFLEALEEPDMDELSENDVATLDNVIEWAKDKEMPELTRLSHGDAYTKVYDQHHQNMPIDLYEMAKEGGATDEQINLIRERDIIYRALSKPVKPTHTSNSNVCTCFQ